jgi:hypothetical protein
MNNLFSFDVTLKDLMNLGERAEEVEKLKIIFAFLKMFWYNDTGKELEEDSERRWNNIRVGSINVYLNEDKHLCMEFVTRFQFQSSPQIVSLLERLKDD